MFDDFYARQQAELEEAEGQRMSPPEDDMAYGVLPEDREDEEDD